MTLLNDLFFILQRETSSESVKARIAINEHHKIFEGHFPGKPVVPGVCMVQIILEIMETVVGKPVRLTEADAIKFLTVMSPKENKESEVTVNYIVEPGRFLINANIFSGPVIFLKLKGVLTIG
jgi:3-hydroxyacyl-[acyl-carrier-protein] dehydratase